jgi:hypothetical protein
VVDLFGDRRVDFRSAHQLLLRVRMPQLSLSQLLVLGFCPDGFFSGILRIGTGDPVLGPFPGDAQGVDGVANGLVAD